MEIWSKGLGQRKLNLRLGEAEVENRGEAMVIKGLMGAPVWWEYSITMTKEDVFDIFVIASQPGTIDFVLHSGMGLSSYLTIIRRSLQIVLMVVAGWVRTRLPGKRGEIPHSHSPPQGDLRDVEGS